MMTHIETTHRSTIVPTEEAVSSIQKRGKNSTSTKHRTSSSTPPPYPNLLRACIRREGYTQREIAQELGIPEGTFRHWVAGTLPIPHREREPMARLLGCSVQELISPPDVDIPAVSSHYAMGYLHGMLAVLSLWQTQTVSPLPVSTSMQ